MNRNFLIYQYEKINLHHNQIYLKDVVHQHMIDVFDDEKYLLIMNVKYEYENEVLDVFLIIV